ncbi:hypothetical protein EsH8_XI_000096 [Colletotrichum jinshuiense]
MVLARALSGIGGAGVMTMASIIITASVPRRDFAAYRSYISLATTLGRSNGWPLGGLVFHPYGGIDTFRERRIPGARFFDLDEVADKTSSIPHTLPDAGQFASAMTSLGITKDDTVVVYDTYELGITSAPRAAWTFKVFGHAKVHVLNNFRRWVEQGYPVESEGFLHADKVEAAPAVAPTVSPYTTPELNKSRVVNFDQVKEAALAHKQLDTVPIDQYSRGRTPQILDARPYGRWAGTTLEPRVGLSSGHIPGSINVPITDVLDPRTKAFLSAEQLRKVFEAKNIDPARPVITTCGSGVTAAVIDAALDAADYIMERDRKLYDGSWL